MKPKPLANHTLRSFCKNKTIHKINVLGVNAFDLIFTDGTKLVVETEHFGNGIYGMVGQKGVK